MEIGLKVLYVTSEANPYAASGGLGDVLGALPKALVADNPDVQAEVIMPLYSTMKDEYREKLEKVVDISFKLSWRSTGATVYKIENSSVTYYFVENHYYFNRKSLYGEYDDAERFAFFSMAVVEFMLATGNIPDILHANDWQTALSVVYLKTTYSDRKCFSAVRTLYTIHNIEYQGKFDPYILGDVFAIHTKYYGLLEYDGCINLMKAAICTSDYVSTVSPHYAEELRHDYFAHGLANIIKSVEGKMTGVINGIDYGYFSPDKGGDILYPYDAGSVKFGKAKNKAALQEELGLEVNENIPLVVMITRLAGAKGIDLVLAVLEELLSEKVQFVVLGTGEAEYEAALKNIESRHENMRALITFNRVISKKMYAAADIFLMPSKSEPCGLSQMISCSYGTVAIVRAVGGLYDSITPYGEEGSNGFTFNNYNAHEMLFSIKAALDLYRNEDEWDALVDRAMNSDFTWKKSASKYMQIYNNLLNW